MSLWLQILLLSFQGLLAFGVGYLLLLSWAAFRADPPAAQQPGDDSTRFLILIPAHNEEGLLPVLLQSLANLDYPQHKFAVHVVADNCADRTASLARAWGATVHERSDQEKTGKGFALQWLLERIWELGEPHDAVLILDADSVISPNFLKVIANRLAGGEQVIQAYYTVKNPEKSWIESLRYAALVVLHYLRPQGRMVLGGSAGLKGNGMAFQAGILPRYVWSGAVTEDIELHMRLILDGIRVTLAADALVWGEMPNSLAKSRSQHLRWEKGRLQMAREYVPRLVKAAMIEMRAGRFNRSGLLLDAVMEHLIPPFSVLAGLSFAGLFLSLGLFSLGHLGMIGWLQPVGPSRWLEVLNLALSVGIILGQAVYLLAGLALVRAPREIYRAFLYAPILVFWKIGLYVQTWIGRKPVGWVKTMRNEG